MPARGCGANGARRGRRRGSGRAAAPACGVPPSEELLHDERALDSRELEVRDQPLERVAELEEGVELLGRVPHRVAVDAHAAAAAVDGGEELHLLATRVLLN